MDRENIQALRQYRKFADLTDRDLQILNWDTRSQLLATLMDGIAPAASFAGCTTLAHRLYCHADTKQNGGIHL